MKKMSFVFSAFSLLLSLTLNLFVSPVAEAKACSAKDKYFYASGPKYRPNGDDGSPAFVSAYLIAGITGSDEDNTVLYDLLAKWKKATKSSALKSAISNMEKQLDNHIADGKKFSYIPELKSAYSRISAIIDYNRCWL